MCTKSELTRLSPRQREVVAMIAEGNALKEIADRLVISVKTVENHVQCVRAKLGTRNASDLTRWALGHDLVRNEYTPDRCRGCHYYGAIAK